MSTSYSCVASLRCSAWKQEKSTPRPSNPSPASRGSRCTRMPNLSFVEKLTCWKRGRTRFCLSAAVVIVMGVRGREWCARDGRRWSFYKVAAEIRMSSGKCCWVGYFWLCVCGFWELGWVGHREDGNEGVWGRDWIREWTTPGKSV